MSMRFHGKVSLLAPALLARFERATMAEDEKAAAGEAEREAAAEEEAARGGAHLERA